MMVDRYDVRMHNDVIRPMFYLAPLAQNPVGPRN